MNSHYVKLSQVILMLDAQGGGKMTLLTQEGKKLTLSHYQLDINKILINLSMFINNSMSCIDLIFCTTQNVISNYGVNISMFKNCHHNIIHGKIDTCVPLQPVCP